MFRYVLIFSLGCLMLTDDVSALRRFLKKAGRFLTRARSTVEKVHGVVKALSEFRKRSVNYETHTLDICKFDSFDLDADQQISEEELSILIDITGLVDLDELFEKVDVNKDDVVTRKEYDNSLLIKESCY